jgi:hypothetical protein
MRTKTLKIIRDQELIFWGRWKTRYPREGQGQGRGKSFKD